MTVFNTFQKKMFYNYIGGSLIAVLGVGSVFIFQPLAFPVQNFTIWFSYFLLPPHHVHYGVFRLQEARSAD
ncbi:hypothetical protein [Bacillus sp. SG-1]|uniref:hypothetical protein n=1 Tax=Bacillus sp. SG-1 TaxID=161544 RepID=UPI0005C79FE7|nr:hypothetical protein [Bacillus sp. SG-1]